jgi:hypothetical protein
MAKIRTIGNKEEILKKKNERSEWEKCIYPIGDMTDKELIVWLEKHFSGLTEETRSGMEVLVRSVWVNAKLLRNLC